MGAKQYNILIGFQTKQAIASIGKFQKRLKGFFSAGIITGFTALTGSALVSFTKNLAQAAGRAETTNRAFERTFGDLADSVRGDIVSISEEVKRAGTDIKKGLVSFQSFFVGLGFGAEEASEFSVNVQKAAIDLASFYGITDEGAQKRFISALAGSPEVLDQFGINLKQAALQVELYNMGIKTTVQNTDELTKTQARLNIINRAMTANGILGDAARNVDSYGNKVKALTAAWVQFKETAGRVVVPILSTMLKITTDLIKKTGMMADESERMFVGENQAAKNIASTLKQLKNINSDSSVEERIKQLSELETEIKNANVAAVDFFDNVSNPEAFGFAYQIAQLIKGQVELTGQQVSKYDVMRIISQEILDLTQKQTEAEDARRKAIEDSIKRAADLLALLKEQWAFQQKFGSMGFKDLAKEIKNAKEELAFFQEGLKGEVITGETKDFIDKLKERVKNLSDLLEGVQVISGESFYEDFIRMKTTITAEGGKIIDEIKSFSVDYEEAWKDFGKRGARALGSAFGDATLAMLSGEASFGTAFKRAIDNSTAMMAADLASKALYHGILAAGYAIGAAFGLPTGSLAKGHGAMSAQFGAGAAIMGGISAAIPNKRTGLGGNDLPAGSFRNIQGQTGFGQVVVGEVEYDKLRLVMQNGSSASFRSNG